MRYDYTINLHKGYNMLAIPKVELSKKGTETEEQALKRINAEIEAKYKAIKECVTNFIQEKGIYARFTDERTIGYMSFTDKKEIEQIKRFLKKCGAKVIRINRKFQEITF